MRKKIVNTVLVLFLLFPVFLFLAWVFKPSTRTNILILDKTVLSTKGLEHSAFVWLLSHRKYIKPGGSRYKTDYDYFGFFPLEKKQFEINDLSVFSEEQIENIANEIDMVYFTDTYGVYHDDWYIDDSKLTEHSEKIYGGLEMKDLLLLKKMKEKKKLILTEFNLFAAPTSSSVRIKAEELLGLKWSGWTGRYYHNLDSTKNKEIPKWVLRLYKEQHNDNWPFTKSGIVFVSSSEKIEILEKDTDLTIEIPVVRSFDYTVSKFSVPKEINYPYWFDITISTDTTNRVLSYYQIHTNERGDSILNNHNIPKIFPAAFENIKDSPFYYFCGDYTDSPVDRTPFMIEWIQYLKLFVITEQNINDRRPFFWRYSYPMTSKILENYYRK